MTVAKLPDATQTERPLPQPGTGIAQYRSDFGGGEALGQAISGAGRQIEAGGDALFQRDQIERQKFDNLKVEEATNQLRQRQLDMTIGDQGYLNYKGANALNRPLFQDYTEQYRKHQTDLLNGLANDDQKRKFAERANVGYIQFQEGLLRHTLKESDSYGKEVTAGVLATEERQAAANWESPIDVRVSLLRIEDALKSQGEREGWAPEYLEAKKLEVTSKIHSAIVGQAIANGNLVYAKDWFEKHRGEVNVDTAKVLERSTKDAYQREVTNAYNTEFLKSRDDPGLLSQLEAKVLQDKGLDDDRRNVLHGRILTRQDQLAKQAEMRQTRVDKYIERGITKMSSVIGSGYEPPANDIQALYELSRGTDRQAEVDQLITSLNVTRSFRGMNPREQSQELTRLQAAVRTGGAVTQNFDAFRALYEAIAGVETGGQADPANATSPENKGGLGKARGRMQIIESTFNQYKLPGESFDNETHRVNAAMRKLADDFNFYGGDIAKTAAAYVGGRGSVGANGSIASSASSADVLGTTPAAYAAKVKASVDKILKSTGAVKFDVALLGKLEQMHESLKRDIKEDPISTAVRQGIIQPTDPAAAPLDMSKPEALDYNTLQRRVEAAGALEQRYEAPMKVLTVAERDQAVNTLRRLPPEGKVNFFASLLKVSSNRGDDPQGMRDDKGGIRAYKAIMAQIAPDEPVLAHAGIAAGRWGDDGQGKRLAELLIQGHAILNPNRKEDGKPDSGKLLPMPPESKMRMDFDSETRDAYAGQTQARSAAYQSARAVYAALSAQAGDKDTQALDSSRWRQSIEMVTGGLNSWHGKNTIMPYGHTVGQFKDGLRDRINSVIASGRLDPSITFNQLWNLPVVPRGDGRYGFVEGDRKVVDKSGREVIVDFNQPAPYVAPPPTTGARTARAPTIQQFRYQFPGGQR